MTFLDLLHHHPGHRASQLRWVLPLVGLLFLAAAVTLVVQYRVESHDVGTEFFRAHKTISNTGQLLGRGLAAGILVLGVCVFATAAWALRMTHRIVRPVHTLHRALEALDAGDLGVRLELHRDDEFQEVGAALNQLVDTFATTLARVHALADRLEAVAAEVPGTRLDELAHELNETMDFFRLSPIWVIREGDA
jgi:methyl-accepting chemotaxis protein